MEARQASDITKAYLTQLASSYSNTLFELLYFLYQIYISSSDIRIENIARLSMATFSVACLLHKYLKMTNSMSTL